MKAFNLKNIILLVFTLNITYTAIAQNNIPERKKILIQIVNGSSVIFEGKRIKKNKSFKSLNGKIYNSWLIEVGEVIYGKIQKGTVEVIVDEDLLEKDESDYGGEIKDGIRLCSDYSTFFCNPTSLSYGSSNTNKISQCIVANICFDENGKIPPSPYDETYSDIFSLYKDLNTIKPIKIPYRAPKKRDPNERNDF